MQEQTIVILLFVAGAVASVVLPYLRNWLESKEAFDVRMIIGQLIAASITVFTQILGIADALDGASRVQAFFVGWGVSAAGRLIQKGFDTARSELS